MRGVFKLVLALALLGLLALGLSACGGDSGDATTGSTRTSSQAATTPGQGPGKGGSAEEGSASFRVKGGDNSIQDFGEEADDSETAAATAVLTGYLEARASGDWAAQCAGLSKTALEPLEQVVSRSPQFKDKGCAAVLKALLGAAPASTRANPLTGDIASLRTEGNRGFALFHGTGGSDYFVLMVKEDGEWRLGATAPSEFP
jgi:hypothetical protein